MGLLGPREAEGPAQGESGLLLPSPGGRGLGGLVMLIQLPGPWELPRHRVTQQRGGEARREREGLPSRTLAPPPSVCGCEGLEKGPCALAGLGCELTSVVTVGPQGDLERTRGQGAQGRRSQGLPGPQGWDCHGPQPDHRHVQPGEGTPGWEGKFGLLGGPGAGWEREGGGPLGPWGGHACGMSGASSCLARPTPGPPGLPTPAPSQARPPTLLLQGQWEAAGPRSRVWIKAFPSSA